MVLNDGPSNIVGIDGAFPETSFAIAGGFTTPPDFILMNYKVLLFLRFGHTEDQVAPRRPIPIVFAPAPLRIPSQFPPLYRTGNEGRAIFSDHIPPSGRHPSLVCVFVADRNRYRRPRRVADREIGEGGCRHQRKRGCDRYQAGEKAKKHQSPKPHVAGGRLRGRAVSYKSELARHCWHPIL